MLVAGPNLTVDRTSTIPALRPGEVLRLTDVAVTPGGKGVNVVRAARALGVPATLVAFLPGHTGRAVAALIADEDLTLRGVPVGGEIRSTAVILEKGGRATVLNEPGPPIGGDDWRALETLVAEELAHHRVLVCSGSLPPGSPEDGYGRLTSRAHEAGRPAIVDANGPVLRAALAAHPDVVTPNLAEAEDILTNAPSAAAPTGEPVRDDDRTDEPAAVRDDSLTSPPLDAGADARAGEAVAALADARPRAEAAAVALVEAGARAAVVTAAAAGAAVADAARVTWIPAPQVVVRNPIGAGDVLTCALAAGLAAGEDVHEAARKAVVTAAASVEAPRAGDLEPARVAELLSRR
jgi:fructose-1-phosphate kinase PfkB-like protein